MLADALGCNFCDRGDEALFLRLITSINQSAIDTCSVQNLGMKTKFLRDRHLNKELDSDTETVSFQVQPFSLTFGINGRTKCGSHIQIKSLRPRAAAADRRPRAVAPRSFVRSLPPSPSVTESARAVTSIAGAAAAASDVSGGGPRGDGSSSPN